MNLVGSGAQYRVYDTNNGRVLKQPLTTTETLDVVKSWYEPSKIPADVTLEDYSSSAVASTNILKQLVERYPELSKTLGNPIFLDKNSYTQDKVQTLEDVLTSTDLEHGKLIIDDYIRLIIAHWGYGFSDNVFNFTINNGIDNQGKIILMDFGEVSFIKADVAERIKNKRWLTAWSYLKNCPEVLKYYYADKMNADINLSKLNETWKTVL